ncbi:peptide transporter MTD1 [Aspergillus luchuensis]|uniref:Peptide transporter MTD1 n=1 Tax=Aspergillus kawachii TaxID=1069201 RepID=A0A146FXW5_ASPKA|nr:peptide transporter MTD1 [Aspergillus luchuensis]
MAKYELKLSICRAYVDTRRGGVYIANKTLRMMSWLRRYWQNQESPKEGVSLRRQNLSSINELGICVQGTKTYADSSYAYIHQQLGRGHTKELIKAEHKCLHALFSSPAILPDLDS